MLLFGLVRLEVRARALWSGVCRLIAKCGRGMHGDDKGAAPCLFFRVDDIEAAVEKIQELGGSVDDVDVEGMRNRSPDSVGSSCARTTRGHRSASTSHHCPCSHMLRRYWPPTS